jgi:hypothetical protein
VKLTRRDFRPERRSKYVAQPLKRRPTLRIILLAALGVAVYLKYDSVINSKAFRNLRQPRRLVDAMLGKDQPAPPVRVEGLAWSPDSSAVEADCRMADLEACLGGWQGLGREPSGALRAEVEKAVVRFGTDASNGVLARFVRAPDAADPLAKGAERLQLVKLELRGAKETRTFERPVASAASLCEGERCLDAVRAQAPFARFRSAAFSDLESSDPESARAPVASLTPLEGAAVRPVLRGRIVEAPADGSPALPGQWVKIYHGENTFSYYRGFASLRPSVRAGAMIEAGDTLGLVAATKDSLRALDVKIEKDGLLVDPYAFLGIGPSALASKAEPDHAR